MPEGYAIRDIHRWSDFHRVEFGLKVRDGHMV